MVNLIKRFLGHRGSGPPSYSDHSSNRGVATATDDRVTERYFFVISGMQYAASKRDYQRAGALARESLKFIPGFVRETSNDHGNFDIRSMPSLERGGRYLALIGDADGLSRLEEVVNEIPELKGWKDIVAQHWEDLSLVERILDAVRSNPYCQQSDVRGLVNSNDGQRIATLISYLEKDHKIKRFREGKTFLLVCADNLYGPPWEPPTEREPEEANATHAETVLAAGRWSTSAEFEKGRITTDNGDCWLWKGALNSRGYGRITRVISGIRYNVPVHQLTWLEANGGEWPAGAISRHLCRNRACCRPEHILPGTPLENMQDAQFRDGTRDVSVHRLPPEVLEGLRRDGYVEWGGQIYELAC